MHVGQPNTKHDYSRNPAPRIISEFELRFAGLVHAVKSAVQKGNSESIICPPNIIPEVLQPENPLDLLLYAYSTRTYYPGGESAIGFKKYLFANGEIYLEDGSVVSSLYLLKMHLARPELFSRTPEKRANALVSFRNFPEKPTESEVIRKMQLEQFLIQKYAHEQSVKILKWKTSIVNTIERLISNPEIIDVPVLAIYPASSRFLTLALESLGAKNVSAISLNEEVISTAGITKVPKLEEYLAKGEKTVKLAKNRQLTVMLLPAGNQINVEKARFFIEEQKRKFNEKAELHNKERELILQGQKIMRELLSRMPRMQDFMTLLSSVSNAKNSPSLGVFERLDRMLYQEE